MIVSAEWPPAICDPEMLLDVDGVTLTGPKTSSGSCSFSENFQNTLYFEIQRYYNGNEIRYKHSRDSSMSFTIQTSVAADVAERPAPNFEFQIHNDRIESSFKTDFPKRCFGIFKRTEKWFLRLRLHSFIDMQKTIVDVSTSRGNQYRDCFQFELDSYVDFFKLDVHAATETGMTQILYNIQTNVLGQDHEKTKLDILKIQSDIAKLQTNILTIQEDIRRSKARLIRSSIQHSTDKQKIEKNHANLKETIEIHQTMTSTKLQKHSYITYALFLLGVVAISLCITYLKHYIRRRDKIF